MSKMSELHSDLETIKRIMEDDMGEAESAEVQIERKIDWLVRELDELCAMANNKETRDLVAKEAIGIGQIHFRAGLILDFLRADKPQLKVVSRG